MHLPQEIKDYLMDLNNVKPKNKKKPTSSLPDGMDPMVK